MRITKLSLTNFRSFKQTQTIEFAPVTLLFGPNSVGKSTVLMALFYLQQILAKGQCDPQRLTALGDKFVGGFENMVNGRDLNSSIIFRIEYDKLGKIGSSYASLTDLLTDQFDIEVANLATDTERVAIELHISWSKSENTAYISQYNVWLNDIAIAEVNSDAGMKQPLITALNYLHPLLLPVNHDEWLKESFDNQADIHHSLADRAFELKGIYMPTDREIQQGAETPEDDWDWPDFTDNCFVSELHEVINEGRMTADDFSSSDLLSSINDETLKHVPVSIKGQSGALPALGKALSTSLSLDDDIFNEVVNELLSDVLIAPLDNLLALLNDSLCIGPLREILDATYQPNPYPQQHDWYSGIAAWDALAKVDIKLLQGVHHWIANDTALNLGYGLAIKVEKHYAEFKPLGNRQMGFENVERQLRNLIAHERQDGVNFDAKSTQFSYSIWDINNNIDVTPADVGVGISQLMPLVVAALSSKKGIIAIEQPELHVHPRVQVAIGDLLTQVDTNANFLIETHSEHLILRMLKRIRQTADSELPTDFKGVKPSDISIVYLEPSSEGVTIRHIKIDEDGEFTTRWPQGFFSERRSELF